MILADNNNNKDNDNDGNNNILALHYPLDLFLQQLWINLENKYKRFYGSIQDTNVLSFSKFVLKCPKNINPWEDTNSDRHALEFLV